MATRRRPASGARPGRERGLYDPTLYRGRGRTRPRGYKLQSGAARRRRGTMPVPGADVHRALERAGEPGPRPGPTARGRAHGLRHRAPRRFAVSPTRPCRSSPSRCSWTPSRTAPRRPAQLIAVAADGRTGRRIEVGSNAFALAPAGRAPGRAHGGRCCTCWRGCCSGAAPWRCSRDPARARRGDAVRQRPHRHERRLRHVLRARRADAVRGALGRALAAGLAGHRRLHRRSGCCWAWRWPPSGWPPMPSAASRCSSCCVPRWAGASSRWRACSAITAVLGGAGHPGAAGLVAEATRTATGCSC